MNASMGQKARRRALALAGLLAALGAACGDGDTSQAGAPLLTVQGQAGVQVVVPAEASPGLMAAAEDLSQVMATVGGRGDTGLAVVTDAAQATAPALVVARVVAGDAALGDEGFRILRAARVAGRPALVVEAGTAVGAQHGLYTVAKDLGARWIHPEESVVPVADDPASARLPWAYDGTVQTPRFAWRGFHEHTQHPIVASDFFLKPDPALRGYVSHYLRWMARNRQNTVSFQLLKTVDLGAWVPWMQDIVHEAHGYGIRVGCVIGFVDEQQNAYKLVREGTVDDGGQPMSEVDQIAMRMDAVLAAGLDFLTLQIGTSEFTKPPDGAVLGWMQAAVDHVQGAWPGVELFAWIHVPCGVKDDEGGYYFHLPLQADGALGAWVHTTMFYDLDHPAPVYGCQDFTHQQEFLAAADGERTLIYYPETAWWLGFDNNVPLTLPITGWSRQHDILDVLPAWDVDGHVTFTTGREHGYWAYDHYLQQVTWDGETTWDAYLQWIAPVWGDQGEAIVAAQRQFTALQRQNFYEDDPLIYFYLAGELPQDEIGSAAGILARRPKIPFRAVATLDDAGFDAWQQGDLALLKQMREAYGAAIAGLPAAGDDADAATRARQDEMLEVMRIFVARIEHTILLYEGAAALRPWVNERAEAAPDDGVRMAVRAAAQAKLDAARAVSADMVSRLQAAEARYRYPVDLLARDKDSLTSYPFGYLAQTSTGYFWTRRDDQLEALIANLTAEPGSEVWQTTPATVRATDPDSVVLTKPEDPVAASLLGGFIPPMLVAFPAALEPGGGLLLQWAQDNDRSGGPDPGTERAMLGTVDAGVWSATVSDHPLKIVDSAGQPMGTFLLTQATFTVTLSDPAAPVDPAKGATRGSVDAQGDVASLMAIVTSIDGVDEEAATNLLKQVYGLDPEQPLPETLPLALRFDLVAP